MAQKIDWVIMSDTPALNNVIPDSNLFHYDLFNITDSQCLVYGERAGDNINLKWGDPSKSDNILFHRQSASKDPIKSGELIAISVRKGGFLVYEKGRWGINLGWSKTPKFEWKIEGPKPNEVIVTGTAVGLYSTVENDYLMYESRDYGINLKWFKDSGKHSTFNDVIKAGKRIESIYNRI